MLWALDEVLRIVAQSAASEVVITIAHAPEDRLAAVISACEEARVPCRLMRRQIEAVSTAAEVPSE